MMVIMAVNMIILAVTAYLDSKDKEFYIFLPVIMLLINAGWRFFTQGVVLLQNELILLGISAYLAWISKQKIGYGDIAIMAALLPLCGFTGIIRVIIDSMIIMLLWKLIRRNKEKEVAFVPYLGAGFLLWCIL